MAFVDGLDISVSGNLAVSSDRLSYFVTILRIEVIATNANSTECSECQTYAIWKANVMDAGSGTACHHVEIKFSVTLQLCPAWCIVADVMYTTGITATKSHASL